MKETLAQITQVVQVSAQFTMITLRQRSSVCTVTLSTVEGGH